MTAPDYLIAAAASWLILACVSGTGWALLAAHHKRRARRTVVRATYPPPVAPPASCRLCEVADDLAAELAAQPVDVWLTPELSDRLFDELIAMEGLQ